MTALVKRSAWARNQANQIRARLDGIHSKPAIGERERKSKSAAIQANEYQARKFERIAAAAEKRGN
ncbi:MULTISPECIES: hypothetical protein [Xanthomonas]|uniref:hypothetical protein n=2 Tax=Xanthomonas TaxID=338 RepID=UPI001C2BD489|nr:MULTISPECIES: hypothetical protein [Xanthomonas]QXF03584.1 hypothetical protein KJA71_09065 [Xanthomonas citri pv. citri]QXO96838.1 hypothetical protein IG630_24115 [Xanthomonas sp. WG16]